MVSRGNTVEDMIFLEGGQIGLYVGIIGFDIKYQNFIRSINLKLVGTCPAEIHPYPRHTCCTRLEGSWEVGHRHPGDLLGRGANVDSRLLGGK